MNCTHPFSPDVVGMNRAKYDFIELVYEYPLFLPLPEREDYFLLPVSIAKEMGLKTAVFTNRTGLTPLRRDLVKGIDVVRFDCIPSMLGQMIRSQPTFVHGHSFGWIPATVAPLLVKKYALTPHIYKLAAYPQWKINLAMSFIKRSSALVALTQFEASQFKGLMSETRINIIPHPVDCEFFSPRKTDDPKQKIEKYGSEKIVLCVSNIFPRKNLETLVRSFAIVKRTFPKSKLLIVGGEPKTKLGMLTSTRANWHYQLELTNLAASLRIKDDVVFTGFQKESELRDFYRIVDVFCLPSQKEGQSLAAGEAASSGLPLVLSNLEPLMEIYQGCALFHEPLDYEELSANIIEIFENPKLARELGNNGHSKMQEYHPTKIRAKLRKLYDSLL